MQNTTKAQLKGFILSLSLNGLLAYASYQGMVNGVEWGRNLAAFLTWTNFLLGLLVVPILALGIHNYQSKPMRAEARKAKNGGALAPPLIPHWCYVALDLALTGLFAAHAYFGLAILTVLTLLGQTVARSQAATLREEIEKQLATPEPAPTP